MQICIRFAAGRESGARVGETGGSKGILTRLEIGAIRFTLVHTLHFISLAADSSSRLPPSCREKKPSKQISQNLFGFSPESHLPEVLLRLAEALRAVHAVLDAAAVDGVVVLVVQQQRRHHDHVGAVRHRVAEVAQLAVVAGHDCFRIAVAGICGHAQDAFVEFKEEERRKHEGSKDMLVTLAGAGWVGWHLFPVFG